MWCALAETRGAARARAETASVERRIVRGYLAGVREGATIRRGDPRRRMVRMDDIYKGQKRVRNVKTVDRVRKVCAAMDNKNVM